LVEVTDAAGVTLAGFGTFPHPFFGRGEFAGPFPIDHRAALKRRSAFTRALRPPRTACHHNCLFTALGLCGEVPPLSPAKGAAMMIFFGLCVLIAALVMVARGTKLPFLPW
jgi:hypothetical protein